MNRDSLLTLLRLRRQAFDESSRHLAACLGEETAATAAIRQQAAEMERQRQVAEAVDTADMDVEAFGAWFRKARERLDELSAAQERAVVETARARAQLTAARSASEAAEIMLREAELADAAEVARREQMQIDDAVIHARDGHDTA